MRIAVTGGARREVEAIPVGPLVFASRVAIHAGYGGMCASEGETALAMADQRERRRSESLQAMAGIAFTGIGICKLSSVRILVAIRT